MDSTVSKPGGIEKSIENDCKELSISLSHECRRRELYLKDTSQEISKLEKDNEKLRLEKKWCFDSNGDRVIPTPEDQAMKLSEQILNDDEMTKEVVKALRMKKLDLQINVRKLKELCDALGEGIE